MIAIPEIRAVIEAAFSRAEENGVPDYLLNAAHKLLEGSEREVRRDVAFLADIVAQLYAADFERNQDQKPRDRYQA